MRSDGQTTDHELLCEGLQFPEGPISLADGSLLIVEIARGTLTRIDATGKTNIIADLGNGPNGAAVGPDGMIYVCNNGGFAWLRTPEITRVIGTPDDYETGYIERVNPRTGKSERIYEKCGEHRLNGPNDIVFDRHGGFYFTDHGKAYERTLDRGIVYYARADGSEIHPVITSILMPNGIALSPDEQTLYVNETETARCWRYRILSPGQLELLPYPQFTGGELLYGAGGYVRFDGVKCEVDGRVCIAQLHNGGIVTVSPIDGFSEHTPLPDRHTTNLSFGGADMTTMYVTLSSTGRVVKLKRPRPGAKLNFVDRVAL